MSHRSRQPRVAVAGVRPQGDRRDAGFILVIVISVLSLLALVAVIFAKIARSHTQAVSAAVASAVAEQLADAGIQLAVLDLVAGHGDGAHRRRFALNGSALDCHAGDGYTLRIAVQDEAGKVDLNAADEPLLRALLFGLGLGGQDGPTAGRIMDFRDADSAVRPDGAERDEYLAASRPRGPKNGPFEVLEELHQVLGFKAADVALLRPYVTVYSGERGIDPTSASAELIAILRRGASQLSPASTDQGSPASGTDASGPIPQPFTGASGRRFFSVSAQARSLNAAFVREAVVEVRPSRTAPYVLWRWHRGRMPAQPGPAPAGSLPSCW